MTSPLIVVLSPAEAASALGSAAHSEPERPTNKPLAAMRERIDFIGSFMAIGNFIQRDGDCQNERAPTTKNSSGRGVTRNSQGSTCPALDLVHSRFEPVKKTSTR